MNGEYSELRCGDPKTNPNKLTIDRQAFLSSIRRVSIFANKTTHQVRLHMDDQLVISAETLISRTKRTRP